ncbi:MAG: 6-phosphofructokinase, partial [Firmicutes bacterium]|nr:6-phosphofructokinase [Bacillota bacterium]
VEAIGRKTGRDTKLVVLSYLQRGGSPTLRDRLLATQCAAKAVELLRLGSDSKAIGTVNGSIMAMDLEEALNQEREVNREMFNLIRVLSK